MLTVIIIRTTFRIIGITFQITRTTFQIIGITFQIISQKVLQRIGRRLINQKVLQRIGRQLISRWDLRHHRGSQQLISQWDHPVQGVVEIMVTAVPEVGTAEDDN